MAEDKKLITIREYLEDNKNHIIFCNNNTFKKFCDDYNVKAEKKISNPEDIYGIKYAFFPSLNIVINNDLEDGVVKEIEGGIFNEKPYMSPPEEKENEKGLRIWLKK